MIKLLSMPEIVTESRQIIERYLRYQTKGVRVKMISQAIRDANPRLYINQGMMENIIKRSIKDDIEIFVAVHPFGVKKSRIKQLRYRSNA